MSDQPDDTPDDQPDDQPDDKVKPFDLGGIEDPFPGTEGLFLDGQGDPYGGNPDGSPEAALRDEHDAEVVAGNKKLIEQQQIITHKQREMQKVGISGINPTDLQMLRMAVFIDFILPPWVDDNNDFGNPERIAYEVRWNEALIDQMDQAIKFGRQQQITGRKMTPQQIQELLKRGGNGKPKGNG